MLGRPCVFLRQFLMAGQRAGKDGWSDSNRLPYAPALSVCCGTFRPFRRGWAKVDKSGTRGGSRSPIGGFGVRCPAIERRACEEKTHGVRTITNVGPLRLTVSSRHLRHEESSRRISGSSPAGTPGKPDSESSVEMRCADRHPERNPGDGRPGIMEAGEAGCLEGSSCVCAKACLRLRRDAPSLRPLGSNGTRTSTPGRREKHAQVRSKTATLFSSPQT